jgi:YVTN family beta-propeller protein
MSGETSRVSVGDEGQQGNHAVPQFADFSADGRYVVFVSSATNLISGSVLPPYQVYVRDRQTNTTFVVSKGIGNSYARGVHQATISDDGSALYVVNYVSGTMSKVRTADLKVIQTIKVCNEPIGITFDSASRNTWVACYGGSIKVLSN